MSRAFVKEQDAPDPRCPGCGGRGVSVPATAVRARTTTDRSRALDGDARFCEDAGCDTAYFDGFGTAIQIGELTHPAWPKDGDAPVCACFGITEGQVEACAEAGDKGQMKTWIDRIHGPERRCTTAAADGRSCEAALRRIFMAGLNH